MLTIQVEINHRVIEIVHVVNEGGDIEGLCDYSVHNATERPLVVKHNPSDGAWSLVEKVAAAIHDTEV
jgi:hypothetical protein